LAETGGGVPGTVGPRAYDRERAIAPPGRDVGVGSGEGAPKEVANTQKLSDFVAIVGARGGCFRAADRIRIAHHHLVQVALRDKIPH
jgi:hypothetical protein